MDLILLQQYWWIIISILAGGLVFLLFVQGGQSMLFCIGKTPEEKDLIVNSLGRKWEFTFTTLVVFGGAFFAAFPLFYATSFGGAYVVWMLILFSFVLQAVSYEYRKKPNNFLGQHTYEVFLVINGCVAPLLIGAAVATFFSGSPFRLNEMNQVEWMTPWRGLDALFVFRNYLLALAVFFLARTLACLYFINNIAHKGIFTKCKKALCPNAVLFLIFFLAFLGFTLTNKGYAIGAEGDIELVDYKYFFNLVEMPVNTLIFVIGVVAVLFGIIKTLLSQNWKQGIWFTGTGSFLAVISLFILAGFNQTAFYPSSTDLNSSLTIVNASSSEYTLRTMAYVSILVPFVIAYIFYAWRAINKKQIDTDELEDKGNHSY